MKRASISRRAGFSVVALTLAALPLVWPGAARAADKAQLAGQWKINRDQSDDSSQKIEEARQNNSALSNGAGNPGGSYPGGTGGTYPGGGYPGGGGIGMGRGGMGGGMGGRGGMGRGGMSPNRGGLVNQEELDEMGRDAQTLAIDQTDKQVSITPDDGAARTLYPDGKKHKDDDSAGQKTSYKTHWDGDRLVVESKLGQGKLAETFSLSPDAKQLTVISRLDDSHLTGPLTIRRVYDRTETGPK